MSIELDDESIPIWVRVNECQRLLDLAIAESKTRGRDMVAKEAAYYSAKAEESLAMLDAGYANTFIQTVIKGRPRVSEAMHAYHEAEVYYKNAQDAIQVYKLKLRVMEAELEREWEQEKRRL